MPALHLLLALLVVAVWGVNFIFIKLSLHEMSPLLLCGLRFLLASIPAVFFIKPPQIPFRVIASYGLIMFGLQFALLFLGMHFGMTAGMTSIVIQVQVFFSMFFAAFLLGETPTFWQVTGALISFMGIGVVFLHLNHSVTLLGVICILLAAATWGAGNLILKQAKAVNMMGLVVWGSFVACVPMLLLAFLVEGPQAILASYHQLTWVGFSSLCYIVYVSTWVGYGVWNWLVSRYPVSMVVPFTLLVPLVAMLSSVIFLGESLALWKVISGLLVISGLCINILGSKLFVPKVRIRRVEALD